MAKNNNAASPDEIYGDSHTATKPTAYTLRKLGSFPPNLFDPYATKFLDLIEPLLHGLQVDCFFVYT